MVSLVRARANPLLSSTQSPRKMGDIRHMMPTQGDCHQQVVHSTLPLRVFEFFYPVVEFLDKSTKPIFFLFLCCNVHK